MSCNAVAGSRRSKGELFDAPEAQKVTFEALDEAEKLVNAEGVMLRAQETDREGAPELVFSAGAHRAI